MSRAQLKVWANFIAYQAVWWAIVYSAGRNRTLPGVLAAVVFVCMQLAVSEQRVSDVRLIAVALLVGIVLDGALAASGVVQYSSSPPAIPPGGAPVWILALWAAFALTLNHSLRWLRGRPLIGALLGAAGGPLAYASSSRLSGAVAFAPPEWRAVVCLAVGWGIAIGLLSYVAGYWARTLSYPPTGALAAKPTTLRELAP
jgi:Protein of unknown function (DUF2878)